MTCRFGRGPSLAIGLPLALFAVGAVSVVVLRAQQLPTPDSVGAARQVAPAIEQARPVDPAAGNRQTAPQVEQQTPPVTFKVEVNYVEVDAVVTDKQGNFVRDLTADDFQLFEDGKPQKIRTYSLVEIPIERIEKPLFVKQPIEPDVQTNARGTDGRIYLLVLDDLHTAALRSERVRAAARRFVQQMGANDQAAVVCTSGRADASQEFTSNQRLLVAAIGKFMGRKLRSPTLEMLEQYRLTQGLQLPGDRITDPTEAQRAYNARAAFDDIRQLADLLGNVHGRRKALVFVSEGVDYNVYDAINNTYANEIRDAAKDAISAATRANVAVYSIDPRGLTAMGEEAIEIGSLPEDPALGLGPESMRAELQLSQDSLRVLADETGGFAAVNTNDFRNAFERIVQENSSYYVLGYHPEDDRRDGRFRRLEVKVNRPGLQVRFRKGYVAPSGKPPARQPVEHEAITSAEVREVLESPVPMSGFTLATFAAPFKGDKRPNASVVVTAQGRGTDLRFTEKAGRFEDVVEVSLIAVDYNGKIRAGDQQKITMSLKPETRPLVQQSGFRVVSRLDLPPGRYQLRVAGRDSNGSRIGSVYYDLVVPDFWEDPLSMSGIVIASARGRMVVTPKNDVELTKALPAPPTAARAFLQDDELSVLAEVYDNQGARSHKVMISSRVLAEDGRTVFRHEDERSSAELGGRSGGYGYVTSIPLKGIPPGLYVLRVEARSTLGRGEPVSREVQFTVVEAPGKK